MRDGLKELIKYFAMAVGLMIAIGAVSGYLTTFKSNSDTKNAAIVTQMNTLGQ